MTFTYSKYHVQCSWAPVGFPVFEFTAWIEGDAATLAFDTEQRVTVKSMHGITSASVTSDETATATLNLQGEDVTCKALRAFAHAQYITVKESGQLPSGPLIIGEFSGSRTLGTIPDAVLTNAPGIVHGDEVGDVAFTFSGRGEITAVP